MKVLLIDDECEDKQKSAYQYVQELKEAGFAVNAYAHFQKAIEYIYEKARQKGPVEDIVVLDMMMPVAAKIEGDDMDPLGAGDYVLRYYLRAAQSSYLRVPIVILTNRDVGEVRLLVEDIGRIWVRGKPELPSFHLPEFLKEIKKRSDELP